MSEPTTVVSPGDVCGRCGAALPLTDSRCCPECLERDLRLVAEEVFQPQPGLRGRLEGSGFTLLEEIGHGGMGVVFRARQDSPSREVAVKVLQPLLVSSPSIRRRLLAEAAAMAELNHPGILPLYSSGEHEGQPWLAMKLATRGSLSTRRREWTGQWRRTAELLAGLADAVQHAHERGLIHRDVKPGNVLFDETDRACLADFGLVKWMDAEITDTLSNALLGTPAYLPPEIARHGARAATIASDIYGLGAILYELLTGGPPFKGTATAEMLQRIMNEEPPPPRRINPDIPGDLEIICLKTISKEPAARYATAAEFAADLRRWLSGRVIHARRFSAGERLLRWAKRNPLPASLAAALAIALAAGGITIGLQYSDLRKSNAAATRARAAVEGRVNFMTRTLVPELASHGHLGVMLAVFEDLRKYYDGPGAPSDAPGFARQADFLTQFAQVLRLLARSGEAREKLDEAVKLASRAVSMPGAGPDEWVTYSSTLRCRGEHAVMDGEQDMAARFTREATETAEHGLKLFPGTLALRGEQADAIQEQAYAAHEREAWNEAMDLAKRALEQWSALKDATSPEHEPQLHFRAQREAAKGYFALGRTSRKLKDYKGATAYFRESVSLRRALATTHNESAEEQNFLAASCNYAGNELLQLKSETPSQTVESENLLTEAETLFGESKSIVEKLTRNEPANQRWKAELGMTEMAMGQLSWARGDKAAGWSSLERARMIFESLKPSAHEQLNEARFWTLRYLTTNDDRSGENAQSLRKEALEAGFVLMCSGSHLSARDDWEAIFRAYASYAEKHETSEALEKELQEWLKRVDAVMRETGAHPLWQMTAAAVHRRLANLYNKENRKPEAAAENRTAFKLRSNLLRSGQQVKPQLLIDVRDTAERILDGVPSNDDCLLIVSQLIVCTPHATRVDPGGEWRGEWAKTARKALERLSPAPSWTAEEQKGLDLLLSTKSQAAASPSSK